MPPEDLGTDGGALGLLPVLGVTIPAELSPAPPNHSHIAGVTWHVISRKSPQPYGANGSGAPVPV